jgi:hypothetical protein
MQKRWRRPPKVVRIARQIVGRQSDAGEQFGDPRGSRCAGTVMQRSASAIDCRIVRRIEARIRIPKDDLDEAVIRQRVLPQECAAVLSVDDERAVEIGEADQQRASVDLPQPDSPTIASVSPGAISRRGSAPARFRTHRASRRRG